MEMSFLKKPWLWFIPNSLKLLETFDFIFFINLFSKFDITHIVHNIIQKDGFDIHNIIYNLF